jgi:hypothetical protein
MKKNAISAEPHPVVGQGVTICLWSDCEPATIIEVSRSGKRITIQEDKWTRTDNNGMSELQDYDYEPNPDGTIHVASLRKDGTFRLAKSKTRVSLRGRRKFHDFSF